MAELTPKQECLLLIAALKYALAGDVESLAPLGEIETRWREINWTAPAFIQASEAGRAGIPPEVLGRDDIVEVQRHLLHHQGEQVASMAETCSATRASATTALGAAKAATVIAESLSNQLRRSTAFISQILPIC